MGNRDYIPLGGSEDQIKDKIFKALGAVLITFVIIIFCLAYQKYHSEHDTPKVKHNVLFIIADDMGWNDISLNNEEWETEQITPNLHNLASENKGGFVMRNAYVTGKCTPTRTAFLTGKYPYKTGTQHGVMSLMERDYLSLDERLLPQDLQQLNYKTYLVGKWHLGYCKAELTPTYRGFDKFFGLFGPGYTNYINHWAVGAMNGKNYGGHDIWEAEGTTIKDVWDEKGVRRVYSTELFAQKAMEYLRAHKDTHGTATPFFMQLAFNAPHHPVGIPKSYTSPCSKITGTDDRKKYCAAIHYIDEKIGEIVAFLKSEEMKEIGENTVIIFTTDNGADKDSGGSSLPFRGGKGSVWEGGTKTSTIVNGPQILLNLDVARNELFHVVDYYATIKAMAGEDTPDFENGRDSKNLWNYLKTGTVDQNTKRTKFVYNIDSNTVKPKEQYAMRLNNYKLIKGFCGGHLYWWRLNGSEDKKGLNSETVNGNWLFKLTGGETDEQKNLYCDSRVKTCDNDDPDYIAQKAMEDEIELLKADEKFSVLNEYTLEAKPKNFDGSFGFLNAETGDKDWCEKEAGEYKIVDTGQTECYEDSKNAINCPTEGQNYYGQDGNYVGVVPSYQDNGDDTVTDLKTGLMWTKKIGAKISLDDAKTTAENLNTGGHTDWRVPSIKEIYSLALFSGKGCSSCNEKTDNMQPYLDTNYFDFEYGDTAAGERLIDAQYLTDTEYVGITFGKSNTKTMFGFNFADGRIKGYPLSKSGEATKFYARYVRGNDKYGVNKFQDNEDGTVTDLATGLMWMQVDSGDSSLKSSAGPNGNGLMDFEEALKWAEGLTYASFSNWRLPNAKELQSVVDYRRSPQTTSSAAIDPKFQSSTITREDGNTGYGWYWTSTTLIDGPNADGIYICFGEALGTDKEGEIVDVHGAGAQRSDPKTGRASDYQTRMDKSPQGDRIRVNNLVRLVRDA